MSKWLQIGGSAIICAVVYFVGFEALQLYSEPFAFVLAIACVVMFLVGLRVNWSVIFKRNREIFSRLEWMPLAVSDLEANYPDRVRGKLYFEAEVLMACPIGVLYVVESPNIPLHQRRCAFGSVFKDSPNIILSPLMTYEAHIRRLDCKSMVELGRKYLRESERVPLSVWKTDEKKQEEVIEK